MGHQDPVWNQVCFVSLPGQARMHSCEHCSIVSLVPGMKSLELHCYCWVNVCLPWHTRFWSTPQHVGNGLENGQAAHAL